MRSRKKLRNAYSSKRYLRRKRDMNNRYTKAKRSKRGRKSRVSHKTKKAKGLKNMLAWCSQGACEDSPPIRQNSTQKAITMSKQLEKQLKAAQARTRAQNQVNDEISARLALLRDDDDTSIRNDLEVIKIKERLNKMKKRIIRRNKELSRSRQQHFNWNKILPLATVDEKKRITIYIKKIKELENR